MKIHLICSPEYNIEDLKEVYELLNSFKGTMEFYMSEYEFNKMDFNFLNYELYPEHNFKFESDKKKKTFIKELGYPLSFEELFSLCDSFRKKRRIRRNDFVVLITNRFNSLNWFSHCNADKNIFIHAAEWEKFHIRVHHKYPVAYQVIENILQNLMDIESLDGYNEFVHYHVRGCINDFCKDKREVILKLRTADICGSCFKRIEEMEIPFDITDQVFQILEGLRTQFLFSKKVNRVSVPYTIYINEDNKLLIPQLGNMELKLEPILSSLYILFLLNPEGIKARDLSGHSSKLRNIYKFLNPNAIPEQVRKSINDLTNYDNGSFSQKKAKINKEIKSLLGDTRAQDFLITGRPGQPFKINLRLENREIHF
jgi:hypothetical protein